MSGECSGISKYERMARNNKLEESHPDYKPLHQPSGRCRMRLKKKALAKENWFKGNNKDENSPQEEFRKDGKRKPGTKDRKPPSTVMFIPNTKGGYLLKKIRENEDKLASLTGFRVSYSEAAGTKMAMLFSLDLNSNQPCGRPVEKCRQCTATHL
jgi:hypothetical protein